MAENVKLDEHFESHLCEALLEKREEIGIKTAYQALQLLYVAQSSSCPVKVKDAISYALGGLAMTKEDIYILSKIAPLAHPPIASGIFHFIIAFQSAKDYITEDIETRAKEKIHDIFGGESAEKL